MHINSRSRRRVIQSTITAGTRSTASETAEAKQSEQAQHDCPRDSSGDDDAARNRLSCALRLLLKRGQLGKRLSLDAHLLEVVVHFCGVAGCGQELDVRRLLVVCAIEHCIKAFENIREVGAEVDEEVSVADFGVYKYNI